MTSDFEKLSALVQTGHKTNIELALELLKTTDVSLEEFANKNFDMLWCIYILFEFGDYELISILEKNHLERHFFDKIKIPKTSGFSTSGFSF